MYLFTRSGVLRGRPSVAMAWATEVTAYVNAHSGQQVTLWATWFGGPIRTVGWSTMLESYTDIESKFGALQSDSAYSDLIDKSDEFIAGSLEDNLRQVVHGTPGAEPPAVGSFAHATTALANVSMLPDAMEWSINMAEHVESVTGHPTMFLADVFGTTGRVTWITVSPDLAGVDASSNAIANNADYMKKLGKVRDLFLPGSGTRRLTNRIA